MDFYLKFKPVIDTILIIVIGYTIIRIVAGFARNKIKKSGKNLTSKLFLLSVTKVLFYVLILLTALARLGVPVTTFLTMVGAVSLAFSLAAKDTLSNLASGFMLMFAHPFDVGDFIESGNTTGSVVEVGFLYTIITTADNKKTYLPNSLVANAKILNYSSCENRRVEVLLPIAYDENISLVKDTITSVLNANSFVIQVPEPILTISDFGKNSLVFTILFWVNTNKFADVSYAIREEIKIALDKSDIKMPHTTI